MRFTFCLTSTKCLSSLVPYTHLSVFPWPTFSFNLSWCLNVNPLDTFSFVCIISQSWLSRHIFHFSRKNLVILQLILNSCGIPESNKSMGVYLYLDIFQRFFSRSQAFIPNFAWKTWIHFIGTKVTSFIKPASLVIPARKLVPTNVIWLTVSADKLRNVPPLLLLPPCTSPKRGFLVILTDKACLPSFWLCI